MLSDIKFEKKNLIDDFNGLAENVSKFLIQIIKIPKSTQII